MKKFGLPLFSAVLLASLMVECTNPPRLTSIAIIPNFANVSSVGETVQFKAIGTYERAGMGHPVLTKDVTLEATWASSLVGVATISPSGLATTTGNGNTTITASIAAPLGAIVGTSTLFSSSVSDARSLTSLRIIPGDRATSYAGQFTQLMAIGTYNTAPRIQDVTNQVHWESSDNRVTTIDSAGLAAGNDIGTSTISASAKAHNGTTLTASMELMQQSGSDSGSFRVLTVFDAGLGSGTITSDPQGINCTSGEGCSAAFALGATVTLTATPTPGSTFGGWSANCLPNTAAACSVVVRNDEPIGVIFH